MKHFILTIAFLLSVNGMAFAQKITDIRKVDFTNYTHKIGGERIKFKDEIQETECKRDENGIPSGDVWNIAKDFIHYGDLDGDGKEEAFMSAVANVCDGNMITNEAILVYKLDNGKIVKLPEFEYFDDGCEPEKPCGFSRNPGVSVAFDANSKSIVVETLYATDNDALCCPSLRRETFYKWNGEEFKEIKKSKIETVKTAEN